MKKIILTIVVIFVMVLMFVYSAYYLYTNVIKSGTTIQLPLVTQSPTTTIPIKTNDSFINYKNINGGYSIDYPINYKINENHIYSAMGPKKILKGVSFTIPESAKAGTNLSSDSYISVEQATTGANCNTAMFTDNSASTSTVTENGKTYLVSRNVDAGVGNRYDQTVYVLPGTGTCTAIRYFIHYGVIENYPLGSVKEFNRSTLLSVFDGMRKTLITNR